MTHSIRKPTLVQAFIPIFFLIVILSINVSVFKDSALSGSNQIGLLLSAAVAGIISMSLGQSWEGILKSAVHRISSAMGSILILLFIGTLAGTWMLSGIVPVMVYYGLQILNPTIFLFAACIISAVVSLSTGSSWTTIATIGVALLVIGQALGLSDGLIGGAIISGAYFGDKISPLSDTTNLAPAMAGTDLFTHIRYMMYTTVPSILITLTIFLIIGFTTDLSASSTNVSEVLVAIDEKFNISMWLLLVPLIVIILIVKKMPAIPALLIGSLLGGLFAVIFQPDIVHSFGYDALFEMLRGTKPELDNTAYTVWFNSKSSVTMYFVGIMQAMYGDLAIETNNSLVNNLLSTSGMKGMLNTVWLILCAMTFGGMMEAGGLLKRITESIIKTAKSTGSLVFSTVSTCIFFNVTAADQYMAIVVPGRMFASTYRDRHLKPELLSRTLEDSGTVTSVLIPWNTCGFTQASVLGVATLVYAPFCFFNIISPIMTIAFAYFNIKIRRMDFDNEQKIENADIII